jgi:hypothetical protein
MRFVEDDRVAVGQELGHAFVAQHHVGEEEVMVHDDDVGLERFLARLHHEAVAVERAVLAEAVVACGRDEGPDARILRDVGQLGPIAALRSARERHDPGQVAHVVARREAVLARGALEVVVAHVVGAPLQQRDGHGRGKRVAHERKVALEELVLERLGPGRHDDLAAVEQRGHEVGERLAGAGAGFRHELRARCDGAADRLRHLELLRAEPEAGQRARQRAAVPEDRVERVVVAGVRVLDFRIGRREIHASSSLRAPLPWEALSPFAAAAGALALSCAVLNDTRTSSIFHDSSSYTLLTRSS